MFPDENCIFIRIYKKKAQNPLPAKSALGNCGHPMKDWTDSKIWGDVGSGSRRKLSFVFNTCRDKFTKLVHIYKEGMRDWVLETFCPK